MSDFPRAMEKVLCETITKFPQREYSFHFHLFIFTGICVKRTKSVPRTETFKYKSYYCKKMFSKVKWLRYDFHCWHTLLTTVAPNLDRITGIFCLICLKDECGIKLKKTFLPFNRTLNFLKLILPPLVNSLN